MNLVLGIALVGLCLPLRLGKVAPNRWYGFRLGALTADPSRWYRVNAYGAARMMGWSGLLAGSGIVTLVYSFWAGAGAKLLCGCLPYLPLVLLLPVLQAWLYARALQQREG